MLVCRLPYACMVRLSSFPILPGETRGLHIRPDWSFESKLKKNLFFICISYMYNIYMYVYNMYIVMYIFSISVVKYMQVTVLSIVVSWCTMVHKYYNF